MKWRVSGPQAHKARRRSREGAWIEMKAFIILLTRCQVAPVRERGLKCGYDENPKNFDKVAPVRERGLKCQGRQRCEKRHGVAPVRERGLKYAEWWEDLQDGLRRSREGAWIEIAAGLYG